MKLLLGFTLGLLLGSAISLDAQWYEPLPPNNPALDWQMDMMMKRQQQWYLQQQQLMQQQLLNGMKPC